MKPHILIYNALFVFLAVSVNAQPKLIIRGDDAGSARSANLAIIQNYEKGILKTTEVMVPCPWFYEAAKLMQQHPGLDVGVHLTITSEWDGYKWKPLTHCPSICDSEGNFLANTWGGQSGNSLQYANINLTEVEAELRAQVETAIKLIPQISHISEHMVFGSLSPELRNLVKKLASEYNLLFEDDLITQMGVRKLIVNQSEDYKMLRKNFIQSIDTLPAEGIWIWIDHPAINGFETQGMKLADNVKNVANDRNNIYRLLNDRKVKRRISNKKIELISYDYFLKK